MPRILRTIALLVPLAIGSALVWSNPEPTTRPEHPTAVTTLTAVGMDLALAQLACSIGMTLVIIATLAIAALAVYTKRQQSRRPLRARG